MTARSFRVFATKEDLISIFNDFQQNNEIQYFKCGCNDDLIKTSNITKETHFGLNIKGNHINNQWLVCLSNTTPLKRKNKFCLDNIFFTDQELNKASIVIDIGGHYENQALFPTEISTIWYENEISKDLYTMMKKSCKKYSHKHNGCLIGNDAYLKREYFRFCIISIDSPPIYDLKYKQSHIKRNDYRRTMRSYYGKYYKNK